MDYFTIKYDFRSFNRLQSICIGDYFGALYLIS